MTAANFEAAQARVLREEGGYSNHPADPGGATMRGVTHRVYTAWRRAHGLPPQNVSMIKKSEIDAIYRENYWQPLRCDALPSGVDYCVFDYGVNSGVGRAGKVLRRVLALADDAVFSAVQDKLRRADAERVIQTICDERLRFLQRLSTWPTFGRGWGARVYRVRAAALLMASGHTNTVEAPAPSSAPGKGYVPVNKKGQVATTGGVIAAGGGAVADAAQSGASAGAIAAIVIAVAVAAVAGFLFWQWRQRRLQDAPA